MENSTSPYTLSRIIRYAIVGATVVLVAYLLWYFSAIVGYILASVVLSLIGKPVVNLLEKIKIGKFKMPISLAALLTLVFLWMLIGGVIALIIPSVASQVEKFSQIDSGAILNALQEPIDRLVLWLEEHNIRFSGNQSLEEYVNEQVLVAFNFEAFSNIFGTLFGFLGELSVAIFSISFITFFFLRDQTLFYKAIMSASPTKYEEQVKNIINDSRVLLTRYFVGIGIQVALITLCVTIGSLIAGLNFQLALTIGFAAGMFNIVPYVGPLAGGTFGIMLAITNNLDMDFYNQTMPLIFKMLAVFSVTQILDNTVFQPVIFSTSVKAHPLELFIVLLIAGNVAGLVGMILAIPGYTFIRIILKQFFSNFKLVRNLTRGI
ncbi:MAG: AI-2E family transporter [Flavobacteriales bacterium]|nr:AI-2E family transporter [Flavobacteriales bacterium]